MHITEIDWGTLVIQSSDCETGRRFTDLACSELRNGLIIRELPGRLRDIGFNNIVILPEIEVAQDLDAFYTWFVEPSLRHFTRIGAFSEAETDAFLTDLKERARRGHYSYNFLHHSRIAIELKSQSTHAGTDRTTDASKSVIALIAFLCRGSTPRSLFCCPVAFVRHIGYGCDRFCSRVASAHLAFRREDHRYRLRHRAIRVSCGLLHLRLCCRPSGSKENNSIYDDSVLYLFHKPRAD